MITLQLADDQGLARAQATVAAHHYLRRPVDSRCSPMAYEVILDVPRDRLRIGVLIVGRPEATRCYDGALTYGALKDVHAGRCQYDRWEILNLARVWLHPAAQAGGTWYDPAYLPGYTDRRRVWRSTLASHVIGLLRARVGYDYLCQHPPCFPDEPYQIAVLLSYCDTTIHRGTIYRAAGWTLARTNARGLETWYTPDVAPLTNYQNDQVLKRAGQAYRSRRYRSQRASSAEQGVLL